MLVWKYLVTRCRAADGVRVNASARSVAGRRQRDGETDLLAGSLVLRGVAAHNRVRLRDAMRR
jgi:hypothetical protein